MEIIKGFYKMVLKHSEVVYSQVIGYTFAVLSVISGIESALYSIFLFLSIISLSLTIILASYNIHKEKVECRKRKKND